MHPKQIEAYRAITPARKLEVAMELYWSARRLKAAWLRKIHPDWTEERVEEEVRRIFTPCANLTCSESSRTVSGAPGFPTW